MKKQTFLEAIVLSQKTITPWKTREGNEFYRKGWNDCLKEIRKNRKKYEKFLSEHLNELVTEEI